MQTRISKVPAGQALGCWADSETNTASDLECWQVASNPESEQAMALVRAAGEQLRSSDIPVAFPTETVYGLGADATRSAAVKGIYAAKGRPSDNPLIIHVCDLQMLRRFLTPKSQETMNGVNGHAQDLIPAIYRPLIQRFWPGPLTILLPNPQPSRLAPEVTAGLPTFGCRMPASPLARTLIKLAGAPLAAPSGNASTKPSPTAASHVLDDLDGRIELILDGGVCEVGVESTVVDGLCSPPVVLRPGGVSLDELRACPGWEGVEKAYRDHAEEGNKTAPRAPGMKYKHYSPRAKVVLYEASFVEGAKGVLDRDIEAVIKETEEKGLARRIAFIRTQRWPPAGGRQQEGLKTIPQVTDGAQANGHDNTIYDVQEGNLLHGTDGKQIGTLLDIGLGQDAKGVAQGLFSALRELDRQGADVIFVEGVNDRDDIAAAVMNRLRKAASETRA
ncbi:translation factor [Thozetella sp. PMI_491]|nr:translation factor [Thozetella sp. PMI_491]